MQFKRNLGVIDRILRIGISALLLYFGFFSDYLVADRVAQLIVGGMGIAGLLVVISGYCPLYTLIGFSTATRNTETAR